MSRCYNCFKEIGAKIACPHCGYEQDTPVDENHLKPGTLITGRYLIGRARGSDENGILYNVFDLKNESKKRMREFFPEEHCERAADGSVVIKPGHEEQFESELSRLKLNAVGDDGEKKYNYLSFNGTGYFIERKNKAKASESAAKTSKVVPEEDDEKLLGGKLPAIIAGAVALIALVVGGFLIFGGSNNDNTTPPPAATPTSINDSAYTWTTDNAGNGDNNSGSAWDIPNNTPETYEYSTPTASITNSYNEWMADPGSHDQVIVTPKADPTNTPYNYNMWDDLERDIAQRATPTPTPKPARSTINGNSSSADISSLQWQLIELGWLDYDRPTGRYDDKTKEAVKAFQSYVNNTYHANLAVDGICGRKTFEYLDNYDIAMKPYDADVTPTPSATAKVIDGNSSPIEIREVQLKLKDQGWYDGEANGTYDYATMIAVLSFQNYVNEVYNGRYLTPSGYVDENTLTAINSYWFPAPGEATPEPTASTEPTPTADPMDETDKLELLYEPVKVRISANTAYVYEHASVNAQKIGSIANGEEYNMIAKSSAWAVISREGSENRYVQLSDLTVVDSQDDTEPDEEFSINPESSEDNIRSLQQQLKDQGWLDGAVDGKYGNGTKAAVSAFQNYVNQVNGFDKLNVTGIADGDTLDELLGGSYLNPAKITPTPTATAEPIVFTNETEGRYVHALANGTAIYRSPDINDILGNVNAASEYPLLASSSEWLRIQNPTNGATAYALKDEFTIYKKDEATPTPTPTPTATAEIVPTTPEPERFTPMQDGENYVELVYEYAFLYGSYENSDSIRRTIYGGEVLYALEESDNWFHVIYTDAESGAQTEGYVERIGFEYTVAPTPKPADNTPYVEPVTPTPTPAPATIVTEEPTNTPEPTPTPTKEPTPTPEPTPTTTEEPTPTPTPTPTTTEEPTPTPTPEPTPTPAPAYDSNWVRDTNEIKRFQDMLIRMGWLDKAELDIYGEYGVLGELTYTAIWNVQQEVGDSSMTSVRDASGFFRTNNGSGDYYPIDEATYNFIMNNLPRR